MVRPADYIHPEDEAARRTMEAIPGFAAAMKLFMRYYDEQIVHGMNMANKIRLSPTQLPEIYQKLPPICQRLSISEPEFYLECLCDGGYPDDGDCDFGIAGIPHR